LIHLYSRSAARAHKEFELRRATGAVPDPHDLDHRGDEHCDHEGADEGTAGGGAAAVADHGAGAATSPTVTSPLSPGGGGGASGAASPLSPAEVSEMLRETNAAIERQDALAFVDMLKASPAAVAQRRQRPLDVLLSLIRGFRSAPQ